MKANLIKLTLTTLLLTCTSAQASKPSWSIQDTVWRMMNNSQEGKLTWSYWSKPHWFKSAKGEVYGVLMCTNNVNHFSCYFKFSREGLLPSCGADATIRRFNVSPAKKYYSRPVVSNVRCE